MARTSARRLPLLACLILILLSLPAPAREPNIVFLLADDLGWMDTGFQGSQYYQTPNLDRLAASGMTFARAYAASPLCSPTRASILTGQYPGRLRFTRPSGHYPQVVLDPVVPPAAAASQKATNPETRTRLPLEYRTLAEELRSHGYRTAFMGKWHLGRESYIPEKQGFEVVVGGREDPGPPDGRYFSPWKLDTLPDVPPGTHIDDVLAAEAVKFIGENKAAPFFLCLWFYSVHAPFDAKPDLLAKYEKIDPPAAQKSPEMAAMIETLDTAAGRVLDQIEALGLGPDTIVIFTSDNGGNMFDVVRGVYPTSNAPLKGGKGTNDEGGVRVPLVVSWPGHIAASSQSGHVVTSPDFFPTLLDLASLPPKPEVHLDGVTFAPTLLGQEAPPRPPIVSHFPHPYTKQNSRGNISFTEGDWKLYRYFHDAEDQTDRFELFNLANDLGELTNLAAAEPDRVQTMNARTEEMLRQTSSLVPLANPKYDGNTRGVWHGSADGQLSVQDGALRIEATGDDPQIRTASTPSLAGDTARLEFEIKTDHPADGDVYWSEKKNRKFGPDRKISFRIPQAGTWTPQVINFRVESELDELRIDPMNSPGRVEIRQIKLYSSTNELLREWSFPSAED